MKSKLIFSLLIITVVLVSSGCIEDEKPKEYKIIQIIKPQKAEPSYVVLFSDGNTTYDKEFYLNTKDHFSYVVYSNTTKLVKENPNTASATYILYLNKSVLDSEGIYISGYHTGD